MDEKKHTKKFVKSSDRYEDINSSGITLIFTSVLGFVFLILKYLDVIHLYFQGFTEYMFYFVMGGMFIAFFVVGILSLKQAKVIKAGIAKEEDTTSSVLTYFSENYSKDYIDECIGIAELSEGDIYYKRYEFIESELHNNFEDIDDSYAEHLIEQIYENTFEASSRRGI